MGVDAYSFLLRGHQLGQRLYVYALARFMVVAGIVAGALFGRHIAGIEGLPVGRLITLACALAVYDAGVFLIVKRYRRRDEMQGPRHVLIGLMHATILLDFAFLTVALWMVGGAHSPFLTFYLFHVILAGVLLSRWATLAHALLGYLFLAGLVLSEWTGLVPAYQPVGAVIPGDLDGRYVLTLLGVYALLFTLITLMLTGLMRLLRRGEKNLRTANAQLERLSEMRRDFLHIALHNLKSPLAAITQYLYALDARLQDRLEDEEQRWIERSKARLKDVSDFVGELQTLALLETEGIEQEAAPVDVAQLLRSVAAHNEDLAQMREQTFDVDVADGIPGIYGIERLLREALVNLLTNAFKYTPKGGRIVLRAWCHGDMIRMEVEDTGIGISQADQPRVFDEFVRIPKTDPRIDTVPSTGLGLSIVRRIAEIHEGTVGLTSQPGKGSRFYIDLPVHPNQTVD